MGFFSSILAPVLKVGAGVFLGKAGAAAVGTLFGEEPEKQIEAAATAAVGGTPTGAVGTGNGLLIGRKGPLQPTVADLTQAGLIPPAAPARIAAPGGMKNVVTTTIMTTAPDGTVLKTVTKKGRPFLMKSDIVAAKRVFKLSSKLHSKLPKRTLKQSEMSKLNEAALEETRRRLTGPSCPPKC